MTTIRKTQLHPDGDKNTILYPETSADQIPDLVGYLNNLGISGKPFTVGTVTTLPAGSSAQVTFTQGDDSIAINFFIPQGAQGVKGAKGEPGSQGEQGEQGATGATGPQGPQGAVGPQGPAGQDGAKGDIGPRGADGRSFEVKLSADSEEELVSKYPPSSLFLGSAAFVGITNPKDVYACLENEGVISWQNQGPLQGPQGEQGIQGPIGPQGPAGVDGRDGNDGAPGATGPTGATGPQGPQGPQGNSIETIAEVGNSQVSGYTKTTLNVFIEGKSDPDVIDVFAKNGATGPQGPKGDKGEKGDKGDKGATGATGSTGPQGPVGPAGPAGKGYSVSQTTITLSNENFSIFNAKISQMVFYDDGQVLNHKNLVHAKINGVITNSVNFKDGNIVLHILFGKEAGAFIARNFSDIINAMLPTQTNTSLIYPIVEGYYYSNDGKSNAIINGISYISSSYVNFNFNMFNTI